MNHEEQKIKCPHCEEAISIDHVLTRQIGEKIQREFEAKQKLRDEEISKQQSALVEQRQQLEDLQRNTQLEIKKQVYEKLTIEKQALWKQAQSEAEKKKASEIHNLLEDIKNRDEKLKMAHAEQMQARAERQRLEEDKRNFEIEKAHQLEQERQKIEEHAYTRAVKHNEMEAVKLQKRLAEIEHDKHFEQMLLKEQLEQQEQRLKAAYENEWFLAFLRGNV